MREHASYYKQFIDVHPGGGTRRNPKRKNAGAYSSPANFTPPTSADIDRVFDSHLLSMARGGTYGDNMEITAFSSAFDYDVKIYQRDFAYMVSGSQGGDTSRPVAHIAYHAWEHYSSIRNLDGPHTGMPHVLPKALTPEEEQRQREKLAQAPHVLPWMIDVVEKSIPWIADKATIKRAIEAAKGNIDNAVSALLDAEGDNSSSSQHENSSVERDHNSDDDMHDGPNKKQDRRMSRASRAQREQGSHSRHALSQLSNYDGSQESVGSYDSEASSQPESIQYCRDSRPNTHLPADAGIKKEESLGTSTPPSDIPAKPQPRLKLLPPKPPDPSQQRVGKTKQRQQGPSASQSKALKKQAQKAARKERHQADSKKERTQSPSKLGISLRASGMTETPPVVDTMRTLYI